ncbi:tRNA lysidine(34) synthetase TilS [Verrucomicrobia bacterium S94]|nr:tRNA lysidine(34) synthetase TilS [Verrucomicrobia bacterium S94]
MNLPALIQKKCNAYHLPSPDSPIVVGVSGGADSVALVRAFQTLNIPCTLAHLNHQLRGAESDGDEAFVRKLAEETGFPMVGKTTDVRALAENTGLSIEMAARQARHDFFAEFREAVIALAHHADDQVETFILKLARGAGPEGLSGMPCFQILGNLRIIRPMLEIPRSAILHWLKANRFTWREDSSNADSGFLRNRVRHRILPLLEKELNPHIRDSIRRTTEILRAENEWMEQRIAGSRLSDPGLPLAAKRRLLRNWLFDHGAEEAGFETVEQILHLMEKSAGTLIYELNARQRVVIEYGVPRFEDASSRSPEISWQLTVKAGTGWKKDQSRIGDPVAEASVCARKAGKRKITVRSVQPGDRMTPLGMQGSRKLQDILTDLKIPRAQRKMLPVAVCEGEIIWLPGYRIARGWEVTDFSVQSLHLKIEQKAD